MASGKPGRNERCPCGSGKKYKHCCGAAGVGTTAERRAAGESTESVLARAETLLRAGRYDEAIGALLRATELVPDHAAVKRDLGLVYLRTGRVNEGILWLERAILLRPNDPASSDAHLALGIVYSETGRFAEAATHFARSIALAPTRAGIAYHGLVSSRRLTEADGPLVAELESRVATSDLADSQAMMLHFAAGKAKDDLVDYASAIEHFDAANQIRRRLSAPFDAGQHRRDTDGLIARFTRELVDALAPMASHGETPILVLGMPRSGTTLIERIVSSHPSVRAGGELAFWNVRGPAWVAADTHAWPRIADKLTADYLALLKNTGPLALRVTDKMPFNFRWVGLVHSLLPNARIVHCRRNPIDTCLSIYSTPFARNWDFASRYADLAAYYHEYLRLMDHWRTLLPQERLLEVDYEEAIASPEVTARRLIAFAGLEWDPACLAPERNPQLVRTASKWQARQPVYSSSVARWKHYEPWIAELVAGLAG